MFCLSGTGSVLKCDIFPPLKLTDSEWEIGLVDFTTYNSIPNIEVGVNNTLNYGASTITLPTGSYEIDDIAEAIKRKARELDDKRDGEKDDLVIRGNTNTFKVEIFSRFKTIDFTGGSSIGPLLGFEREKLKVGVWLESALPLSINKVNVIRIECNVVRGSYDNGRESHVIHEFYPTVPPGYKIVETPRNVIYLPVGTTQLDKITVSLKDQTGELINFRNEVVNIRLHLRRV